MGKYHPSNGTEGMWFIDTWCAHCKNEQFMQSGNPDHKCCEILTASMTFSPTDEEYPSEWIEVDDKPQCTAFIRWKWKFDEDGNPIDNSPYETNDPNQLSLL